MSIVSYQYEQHTKIPLQTNWGLLQRSGLSINFTLFLKPNLPLWLPWDHLLEFGQPTLGLTGMAAKIVQTFAQRNVQPLKKVDIRDNGVCCALDLIAKVTKDPGPAPLLGQPKIRCVVQPPTHRIAQTLKPLLDDGIPEDRFQIESGRWTFPHVVLTS